MVAWDWEGVKKLFPRVRSGPWYSLIMVDIQGVSKGHDSRAERSRRRHRRYHFSHQDRWSSWTTNLQGLRCYTIGRTRFLRVRGSPALVRTSSKSTGTVCPGGSFFPRTCFAESSHRILERRLKSC